MRIVYATDIHGAWKGLRELLEITNDDLYIIAGDLIDRPFRTYKSYFRFTTLQEHFRYLKCRARTEVDTRVFVEGLLLGSKIEREERDKAREYIRLHRLAHKTMLRTMDSLASLLSEFPEKKTLVLPGNYDIDLRGTPLDARNLHKTCIEFSGLRIAGYGGAGVTTPGIPEDLAVKYREAPSGGRLQSEPRDFLSETKPDIAVIHMPPFGVFDRLRSYGNIGSVGVRDYAEQLSPPVVLCGHMHENWGVVAKGGTVFINPSNFGEVPDIQGVKRRGYFFDFLVKDKSYQIGTLRQIERKEVHDLIDYLYEDGSVRELQIDIPRIRRLSRERAQAESFIQEIRDFNRVRDFFRGYETKETRKRINDLRGVYRTLRDRGELIAFDILGSVNFGMSEQKSDVDLVLYRRCPCKHSLPETTCALPVTLFEKFNRLGERYHVEVIDCVNLNRVEASIREGDPNCQALQRFALYRSICRPINVRMIRETENLLRASPDLKKKVEYLLKDYFRATVLSHSHIYSFKKYEVRLHDQGVNLPPNIVEKLHSYLNTRG